MAISIKAVKLSGRLLAKVLALVLRRVRNPKMKHGRQSVKSLARHGTGLQNIEITDSNIRSFDRVARKYGVDFALKRDAADPAHWLVFFKAKDAAALTAAFQEFTQSTLGKRRDRQRPSLLAQVDKFKEASKDAPVRERYKDRGGHER